MKTIKISLLILTLTMCLLTSCTTKEKEGEIYKITKVKVVETEIPNGMMVWIENDGKPSNNMEIVKEWNSKHSDLQLTGMCGDARGGNATNSGYYYIFKVR